MTNQTYINISTQVMKKIDQTTQNLDECSFKLYVNLC